MKKLNLFMLIAFLLSSCAPVAIATSTPIPTRTATLTPTNTPKPTSTPTPTPKIYTLRIEFSSTGDWSNLTILDSSSILDARLVEKQGNLTFVSVDKTFLGVGQSPADAQALKEVSITVDLDISENAIDRSIPFLLQKSDLNDSDIRFYNLLNGKIYSLLDEVYRAGGVEGSAGLNPYNFSFDLELLFQDVTAIATLTQSEVMTGKLIFEYYKVAFEGPFPDLEGEMHVFMSNIDGIDLTPITNGLSGFNRIESISASGGMVLVSSRANNSVITDLYIVHLNLPNSEPIKIAKGLKPYNNPQAIFLDNTRIVYIGQGSQGYGFYKVNIDGTNPKKIGAPIGKAWGIVSSDETRVYWQTYQEKYLRDSFGSLYAGGDVLTLWWTNIEGPGQGELKANGQQIIGNYEFSRDGKMLAWIPAQYEPGCTAGSFYTKWITEGTYTEWAALSPSLASRHGISESWLGKTIDMDFVDTYVRQCFILYVASPFNLDNPTKIVLMPPTNLIKGDFTFGEEYNLIWEPDGSRLLLFNNGHERYFVGIDHEPLLYYVNLMDSAPKLVEYRHSLFSRSGARKTSVSGLSPDGQKMLIANWAGGPYIRILDLNTLSFSDLFGNNLAPDTDVSRIGSIYWLP